MDAKRARGDETFMGELNIHSAFAWRASDGRAGDLHSVADAAFVGILFPSRRDSNSPVCFMDLFYLFRSSSRTSRAS